MTLVISGIVALALGGVLWAYLRVRVRQLECGVRFLDEFSALADEVAGLEIPERDLHNLVAMTEFVATGHIARYIFRQMLSGKLASKPSRDAVAANRKRWSGVHSTTRILYVRTFFAAIRADSYFAGTFRGTMFRRAFFYISSDPEEIAHAIHAMETKILMLGVERAVELETKRHSDGSQRDKALVRV